MNKIATQERNPASSVALSQSGSGSFLKAESLGDVVRFAELMCQSKAGIPSYLHGNAPDCMAVTMQALQWEFNPFSVAQKSYKIKDVIAYEAQLIAAVINTRADLKRRPQIEYRGEGAKRQCIVTFEFKDGSVQVYESPESEKISPKNSPLWKTDPDQQLAYYSLRAGARRYCPEVILGAYDRDEVEEFRGPANAKDITPSQPSVMDRLKARSAAQESQEEPEGFSRSFAADEPHDALTGEIIEPQNAGEDIPAQPADDAAPIPAIAASTEGGGIAAQSSSPSNPLPTELRQHLMDFARNASKIVEDTSLTDDGKTKTIEKMVLNYQDVINQADWGKISAITVPLQAVFAGKRTMQQARKFIAGDLLDCDVTEIGG